MKKLLIAIPVCLLMVACGSKSEGKDGETTTESGFTAKSEYYSKFDFSKEATLEGTMVMGQSMEDVKKNHTKDEMTDEDEDYLSFERKLGASEDEEASYFYSFDSETKKLDYATIDIYPSSNATEEELYNDLITSFENKYGKASNDSNGKGYSGKQWSATVGGHQTSITVEHDTQEDYGWITVTFSSEEY